MAMNASREMVCSFWVCYDDSGVISQGIDASVLEAMAKIS